MITFKDKLVWVTGASSGIGQAMAIQLAAQGAKLIISGRKVNELDRLKTECLKVTSFCEIVPFDLSNPDDVLNAAKTVLTRFGAVYGLVNNGGISQRSLSYETPVEIDRKIMEIDFFSYITLTKSLLPSMMEKKEGFIAVTSSITGKFGFHQRSAYSSAKHALQGFFETLRIELIPFNIAVTVAYPGFVKTNISFNALEKNGQSHGIMDSHQDKGISADYCAKKYLKAIKKGKAEVIIAQKEWIMVYLKRFFPSLFFHFVSRVKPT